MCCDFFHCSNTYKMCDLTLAAPSETIQTNSQKVLPTTLKLEMFRKLCWNA